MQIKTARTDCANIEPTREFGSMHDPGNCDLGLYHLTSTGWVRKDSEPFPPNRYETWLYEEERPASDAKDRIHLTRVWRKPGAATVELEKLHTRFGEAILPDADRHLILDCSC
jgi:hypothetical protein